MGLTVDFIELFEGNPNAWGTAEGGCARGNARAAIQNHLYAPNLACGIYPLATPLHRGQVGDKSMWVKWGCSDIDLGYEASWPLARRLHQAFELLGIKAWIEMSRSKGYHVWVFATDWVHAETMRHAFLAAHKIADVPAKEVNPKQVSGVELGNYVRLPYPYGSEDRQRMVPHNSAGTLRYDLRQFLDEALIRRVGCETLNKAAALYKPPAPKREVRIDPAHTSGSDKMSGLTWTIYKNGPLEGRDRSGTLARLAHLMRDDGLTPGEALIALTQADEAWGKYHARNDGEYRLMQLIQNAYG